MAQITKNPTAILFSGGGAKGAFQVGAMQAVFEAGITGDITAVAGTSVGALNAVLFALGDPVFAKQIWQQIQPSDLLTHGNDGAFFSREGMIRMLSQLPLDRISTSDLDIYVCAHDREQLKPVFFKLNGLSVDAIRTLLLASSAIPAVFAPERYLGREYIDGSMSVEGDLCITPVYAQGHREILMISNRPQLSLYGGTSVKTGNLYEQYPDCNFTLIKPMRPMGNLLTGTLNFAQDRIHSNIEQGYQDAKAVLGESTGSPKTKEEINAKIVEKMQRLFPNAAVLSGFLSEFGTRFAPNVPFPTLGGNVFYDNIFEVDGWRLQQHRTLGMQIHYRFLDANNVRVGWVLQPQLLLDALTEYEAVRELRSKS